MKTLQVLPINVLPSARPGKLQAAQFKGIDNPGQAKTIQTYIGQEAFSVPIDDSPALQKLVEQAQSLRNLCFAEKLKALKQIAIGSMENAVEGLDAGGTKARECKEVVFNKHPLSYALEKKLGCCRYQGALFFVLAYEAQLGDKHYLQVSRVNSRANSIFNDVVAPDGTLHHVSIFRESLKDKSLDYAERNPRVFAEPYNSYFGSNHLSYHKTDDDSLVLISSTDWHTNPEDISSLVVKSPADEQKPKKEQDFGDLLRSINVL